MSNNNNHSAGDEIPMERALNGDLRPVKRWRYNNKWLTREDLLRLPLSVRLDIANGSQGLAGVR